ncbi:MAG: DUF4167 domain-containing protein [Thermaurantiacus sp.]
MQSRQSGRRRRGGGGGSQPRPLNQPMGGQSGNRLENRVRGNATQLLEKYKQLARDAHQGGDRVAAEYYLQHADHYFRVLNDVRIRQDEMRSRRGAFDQGDEDDADEETETVDTGADGRQEAARRDRAGPRREPPVVRGANGHGPADDTDETDSAEDQPMSDGEAALIAFGGAPATEAASEADADEETAERPTRRRGRPRKTAAPAVEG